MESPRELAAKIADHQAYVDQDAVTVAEAYRELLETLTRHYNGMAAHYGDEPDEWWPQLHAHLERAAEEPAAWRGVYPMFCRDPEICRGHGACPRNPSCSE